MPAVDVEICVQGVGGAQAAFDGGADRVELCSALEVGGLTPDATVISAVRGLTARPGWLQVLVRARPGGFRYSAPEVEVMCMDIASAVAAGADGVVVGALTESATIDLGIMRAFLDAAGDADVTFHRAFDEVRDRASALDTLADLGIERVLTSCGAERAVDAVSEFTRLVGRGTGVQIMAGGGVRAPDVEALARTGVDALHSSARGPAVPLGRNGTATDPRQVQALVTRARVASGRARQTTASRGSSDGSGSTRSTT